LVVRIAFRQLLKLSMPLALVLTASAQDFVIHCGRVITVNASDEVIAQGSIEVTGGKITYVGAPRELPADTKVFDYPEAWAAPGLVDLHTHIHTGGWGDINDMVRSVNPGLRACSTIRPDNSAMRVACAAGVTTLFGIPGSGTNIGGFGVLYKPKSNPHFEKIVVQKVGGMKVAQDSNPARRAGTFAFGNNRASMGWILRNVCARALGAIREERFDFALEDLKKILTRELPVLIHTAGSEGVVNTARLWGQELNTRCTISHGSFDGWKAAAAIAEWGVPVNHGPRTMAFRSSRNGRVNGTAAEYVNAGVKNFSLNTDSPVVAQEQFFLQATMSSRLGADPSQMMRALTIHPAINFGLDDRVGSLEVSKDADIVLHTGDPLDPRSHVLRVWIDGQTEYEHQEGKQRF
jgi:imidazolonepropionase-like amidohydrolase